MSDPFGHNDDCQDLDYMSEVEPAPTVSLEDRWNYLLFCRDFDVDMKEKDNADH